MNNYLKIFKNNAEYEEYKCEHTDIPQVSHNIEEVEIHYGGKETRVVAKFNVTDTSNPTQIGYNSYISGFSAIEIDCVEQPEVVSAYTFSTTGEHTVKYTLTDPATIGLNAFNGCSALTSVYIPYNVTTIGIQAFKECPYLRSITINSGVMTIGDGAFNWCARLTSIDIPDSVTTIGNGAFYYCGSLRSIDIPDSVTTIGQTVFKNCSGLASCTIGSGVTSIGNFAFSDCTKLTSIILKATTPPELVGNPFSRTNCLIYVPSNNIETYKAASGWSIYADRIKCADCPLTATLNVTSTTEPTEICKIGNLVYRTKLSSIEIDGIKLPQVVSAYTFNTTGEHTVKYTLTDPTTIGDYLFSNIDLTSIDIPDNILNIGFEAFAYCTSLTSIVIPDSVISIYSSAFKNCSGLASITVEATTPPKFMASASQVFDNTNDCPIYVPSGSVNTYKSASGWSTYASRIQAIP